jgi:hypothetical protein
VAQRLYAPLGTELSLGEYVRLNQRFVDLFAHKRRISSRPYSPNTERKNFNFNTSKSEEFIQGPDEIRVDEEDEDKIDLLARDLKVPTVPTIGD